MCPSHTQRTGVRFQRAKFSRIWQQRGRTPYIASCNINNSDDDYYNINNVSRFQWLEEPITANVLKRNKSVRNKMIRCLFCSESFLLKHPTVRERNANTSNDFAVTAL